MTIQAAPPGLVASAVATPRPGAGWISISGISARGFHGVFESERVHGQDFVVDLVLAVDLDAAANSDDLSDTVDYGGIAAEVVDDIEGEPVNLIEALAARIADTCLRFERVTSAAVTVHKPQAPMPVRFLDVAVTLVRSRPNDAGTDHAPDGENR